MVCSGKCSHVTLLVKPATMVLNKLYSWSYETARDLLINVLAAGPIPRHVAFVLDGNRRYARAKQKETLQGHHEGFHTFTRVRGAWEAKTFAYLVRC